MILSCHVCPDRLMVTKQNRPWHPLEEEAEAMEYNWCQWNTTGANGMGRRKMPSNLEAWATVSWFIQYIIPHFRCVLIFLLLLGLYY